MFRASGGVCDRCVFAPHRVVEQYDDGFEALTLRKAWLSREVSCLGSRKTTKNSEDLKIGRVLEIRGAVVLITGAAQGIGAACAPPFTKGFTEAGAQVALLGVDAELSASAPDGALTVTGDITEDVVRQRFLNEAVAPYGRVDVLINNVGVGQFGFPSEVDVEVSKRMFDVNVFSLIALTQLVLPEMRRGRSGAVVNIGSVGGEVGLPWAVMYCATKFREHALAGAAPAEVEDIRWVVTPRQIAEGIAGGVAARGYKGV
jgi:NADP-dependent 3-hydroxy acid dehydrogenase YdfG